MKVRIQVPLRIAAVAASTAVVSMMVVAPASAAEGDVQVVNTETVQVYTDATGSVETRRIYEQVSFTGTGEVDLRNPIETEGLRNLDGFGGFDVKDGVQEASVEVDGEKRLRTVSDYDGDLPLDIQVRYYLDGKPINPEDVVGKSGLLEVKYKVTNVTAKPQEVTFDDGTGSMVTKTVDVPIPIVGSLTVVAPSNFTDVASGEANMAGDGKGGTKLSFTMTLFPPIGSDTAEFGYSAQVTDGVIPRASVTALPVNPLEVPSFKSAGASYQGGADTGIELTDGAGQIDANVLKLRDGAAELLAGLIQLRDGANQLQAGLAGEAAPGAAKLADGAGQLNSGIGQLDDGANKLFDGAGQLAAGTGQLSGGAATAADGSRQLRDGARTLDDKAGELADGADAVNGYMGAIANGQADLLAGLKRLEAGVEALPATVRKGLETDARYQALLAGMQSTVLAIGNPGLLTNPETGKPTLYGGLTSVKDGLNGPILGGLDTIKGKIPASWGGLNCASLVLKDLTSPGNDAPGACYGGVRPPTLPDMISDPTTVFVLSQMSTQLAAGRDSLDINPSLPDDQVDLSKDTLRSGVLRLKAGITGQIVPGVDAMMAGVFNAGANQNCAAGKSTADPSDDCGLVQAVGFFRASIPVLVDGITANISETLLAGISAPAGGCKPTTETLICGATALAKGGSDLAAGTSTLAAGANQLDAEGTSVIAAKLGELTAGLNEIAAGAGQLDDGAGQLADGAGQLADGTGKASDGAGQLSDGANQLATGLSDAANGSGRLADGLGQAADGAPQLRDGAQRLSDEGTSKLVEAGKSTAQNYGELYATMQAGAERADAEKMVYGAPEDAIGLAAYSYEIKGEDGEGGRNVARGLGALAVLGAGAGAFALRRRLI